MNLIDIGLCVIKDNFTTLL